MITVSQSEHYAVYVRAQDGTAQYARTVIADRVGYLESSLVLYDRANIALILPAGFDGFIVRET